MKIPRDCARVLALAPVEQKEHSDEVTRVTKDLRNDGSYLHLLNLLQRVWGLAVRVFDRCVRASCAVAPTVCGVLDVDRFLRSALNPKKIKEMLLYCSRKIDALTILASKHCPRTPRPVGFLKKKPHGFGLFLLVEIRDTNRFFRKGPEQYALPRRWLPE